MKRSLLLRFAFRLFFSAGLMTNPMASFAADDPSKIGKWDPPINWPNVAIHMHVLPDGKVLFWSRREWDANAPRQTLDSHESTPRIWDPQNPNTAPVALQSPALRGSPNRVNLFCSGHTFLADGK